MVKEDDCISREQALVAIRNLYPGMPRVDFNGSLRKWVDKYKPYIECDDAIKQLPSVTPQEPQIFKWCDTCREYDQEKHCCHRWSRVIRDTVEEMKQEYIERDVLDKIRAEIIELRSRQNVGVLECLDIIDKYKAESEKTDG